PPLHSHCPKKLFLPLFRQQSKPVFGGGYRIHGGPIRTDAQKGLVPGFTLKLVASPCGRKFWFALSPSRSDESSQLNTKSARQLAHPLRRGQRLALRKVTQLWGQFELGTSQ